jgi:hypothetical protein
MAKDDMTLGIHYDVVIMYYHTDGDEPGFEDHVDMQWYVLHIDDSETKRRSGDARGLMFLGCCDFGGTIEECREQRDWVIADLKERLKAFGYGGDVKVEYMRGMEEYSKRARELMQLQNL